MKTAWMFPGQGSQAPGMGRELIADCQLARDVLSQASNLYGDDLDVVRRRGPSNRLASPDIAELLIASMQISYASLLKDANISVDTIAGYSAGEVGAFFASDVLTRDAALHASLIRGRVLKRWTRETTRMVSVTGLSIANVERLFQDHKTTVEISARNSSHHVTLVGDRADIVEVERVLSNEGATVATVDVAGPWHSRSIVQAAEEIHTLLRSIEFHSPSVPLYLSATGEPETDPCKLRHCLASQVASPVLWESILDDWKQAGVNHLIEVGSGRHLQGILRNAWPQINEYHVECLETPSGRMTPLKRLLTSSPSSN